MGTDLTGTNLTIDVGTLYAFLLVLARISGAFIFVPIPGIQAGPQIARTVLSASLTLALHSRWPVIDPDGVSFPLLMGWMLAEAAMGLAVGLAVAFLIEGFQMGAQIISLQAGYSFASTIDPTSGADSTVLIMIAQTTAGLLFFATGMDRQILRAFADSLTAHPPGHFAISVPMVTRMVQAGSSITPSKDTNIDTTSLLIPFSFPIDSSRAITSHNEFPLFCDIEARKRWPHSVTRISDRIQESRNA